MNLKDLETIRSTRPSDEYRRNWDVVFGQKKKPPEAPEPIETPIVIQLIVEGQFDEGVDD